MDLKYFLENNKINSFINSKYKKYKIAYHITTFKNAQNILKNGFDVSKSKSFAFGKGINLTTDINHLKHYYYENTNIIILCIIRYNKLKYNTPLNDKEYLKKYGIGAEEYIKKYKSSNVRYMDVPKGYEGFYNDDIIVMKNKKYVHPVCTLNF